MSWAACTSALALAASGSILGGWTSARPLAQKSAGDPPPIGLEIARPARGGVTFDEKDLAKIFQHSPLPDPPLDRTNAMAEDPRAAALGQWLFFAKQLSANAELACTSCHDPSQAFADGRALAQGLGTTNRNAPALWNAAWQRWYFWDGRADSLWAQALQPIENPVELGGNRTAIAHSIGRDPNLRAAYEAVFGPLPDLGDATRFPAHARPALDGIDDDPARSWSAMREEDRDAVNRVFANTGKALEAYVRQIQSRNSAFDRYVAALRANDPRARATYPEAAQRGLALFIGKANCRSCHAGPNFTDNEFHNVGVPSRAEASAASASSSIVDAGRRAGIDQAQKDPFNAAGAYSDDRGGTRASELASLIRSSESFGQFKTPSLRNVALTAPYMHQGQFATLADVLHYYSTLEGAVPAGHHGEQVIRPLHLTPGEIDDLLAFLRTLTDAELPRDLLEPPSSPLANGARASAR